MKKCSDDSETFNWISAHTKECPKCSYPTEKNGGCNHMTCKKCRYEVILSFFMYFLIRQVLLGMYGSMDFSWTILL